MTSKVRMVLGVLLSVGLIGLGLPVVAQNGPDPRVGVDKAFETLKSFDWGQDRAPLGTIEQAVAASHDNAAAKKDLETRLTAMLKSDAPQAAKDFACRQLSLVGSADCTAALAGLLTDKKLSHMARYALERIGSAEAVTVMRDALPKVSGRLKVGVINSLGVRRDAKSTGALVALLSGADNEVASAAAAALGLIANAEAAKALGDFQAKAPKELRLAAADAYLTCAERLLAEGKKAEATTIYKALNSPKQPKHVRLAAMRGLLAAMGKK